MRAHRIDRWVGSKILLQNKKCEEKTHCIFQRLYLQGVGVGDFRECNGGAIYWIWLPLVAFALALYACTVYTNIIVIIITI